MRHRAEGRGRVTNVELFYDLVYVFAVTQLSHYLLHHRTLAGALQAGLLLVMVWLFWAYTTWLTNWLDPERIPVRLLLIGLMLVSLAFKLTVWHNFCWQRAGAVVVLALLALAAPHVSALVLSACAAAVVVAVATADFFQLRAAAASGPTGVTAGGHVPL